MVTKRIKSNPGLDLSHLPINGSEPAGTKWLIGAVLAAGKDGCACTSCQLLKKFGGVMSEALLKEGDHDRDQDPQ